MEEMIDEMLVRGIIKHLVAKKDGTRFCVDYRRLNSITKMDTFLFPRVDDSLDLLANTSYFTTLVCQDTGRWGWTRSLSQKQPFVPTLGCMSSQ